MTISESRARSNCLLRLWMGGWLGGWMGEREYAVGRPSSRVQCCRTTHRHSHKLCLDYSLNQRVGLGVEAACGFVEHEDLWSADDRSDQCH